MQKGSNAIRWMTAGLMVLGMIASARAEDQRIRAKVGILVRSGDDHQRARSRENITAGDLLRLYIHPEHSYHVYVVHSDQQTATMLNALEQKIRHSSVVLPSAGGYYEVDGKSSRETFAFVCSPTELPELTVFNASGKIPHQKWVTILDTLTRRGHIDLSQQTERPFSIAGNVRSSGGRAELDPFIGKLPIYSGRSLLVKTYEFRVKK